MFTCILCDVSHAVRYDSTRATTARPPKSSANPRLRHGIKDVPAEESPLTRPEPKSMRYLLLENVTQQQIVTTQLFSLITTSLSPHTLPNPAAPTISPEISSLYTRLQALDEEHQALIELTRKHQAKWEKLQRRRRKKEVLEERVRGVLMGLERMGRELGERNVVGREVVEEIERSERGTQSVFIPSANHANILEAISYSQPKPRNPPHLLYPHLSLHLPPEKPFQPRQPRPEETSPA